MMFWKPNARSATAEEAGLAATLLANGNLVESKKTTEGTLPSVVG
jgi:hypothetical protein